MNAFDCLIIRHKKENLRKCSLRGLEGKENFAWITYPFSPREFVASNLKFDNCILLDMEGEILSEKDARPLILLDASWRYALKMREGIPALSGVERRRLPNTWKTAYPRRQTECPDPERGLASIEAIFAAFYITGRSTQGLLDTYYWKDLFLEKNSGLLSLLA